MQHHSRHARIFKASTTYCGSDEGDGSCPKVEGIVEGVHSLTHVNTLHLPSAETGKPIFGIHRTGSSPGLQITIWSVENQAVCRHGKGLGRRGETLSR